MLFAVKNLLSYFSLSSDSLKAKVIKASSWSVLFYTLDLLLRFSSSLILTRLLFPEAYGLMAVAGIIPTILIMWSDVGLRSSIIRHPEGNQGEYLSTAWIIQSLRGLGIWLVILLIAFIFGLLQNRKLFSPTSVFDNPKLMTLIMVMGFSVVLTGLESTKVHLAYRELQLKYMICVDITARLLGFLVMLFMCLISRSVWVLAIGSLTTDFVKMILSHLILKGPSFKISWNKKYAADIFQSGKWIACSSFFSLVTLQGDRILLGLFFPASILGVYSIAIQIISCLRGLLDFNIGNIVPTIFGETFRVIPDAMKERYYKIRQPLDMIAFFFVGILLVAAPFLISSIYDSRYSEAGWMLQWLSFGLFVIPFETVLHAFPVVGKASFYALISMLQAVLLITLSLLGYHFLGLSGMIAAIGCYRIFSTMILIIHAHSIGWISIYHEFKGIKFLIFGLLCGFIITFLGNLK